MRTFRLESPKPPRPPLVTKTSLSAFIKRNHRRVVKGTAATKAPDTVLKGMGTIVSQPRPH